MFHPNCPHILVWGQLCLFANRHSHRTYVNSCLPSSAHCQVEEALFDSILVGSYSPLLAASRMKISFGRYPVRLRRGSLLPSLNLSEIEHFSRVSILVRPCLGPKSTISERTPDSAPRKKVMFWQIGIRGWTRARHWEGMGFPGLSTIPSGLGTEVANTNNSTQDFRGQLIYRAWVFDNRGVLQ